ncbi:Oidioi.mRNA.OKI2018_I69.chr1.g2724.t1.cds [Oikopleura dioica]|uniref:Oidioi.mRNA.OKI2018_I69.chr1.g2724.t1.cds n=1 Tax=Oikopleura dioica TaxID=34765 RepID=A0ABN7STQ2_OIKDI|nr:Oidioi.mRNA.OKI2018_I69.chr1.g2724.t1.cds [Oikopleura dioica]
MENVEKRPVLNYVLLLVLFMLLLIGNLQRAVEDDPNFDPDILRLDNGKNKYFLNDPIPVAVEGEVDSEGYPAWYSRSIEDLLLDASSIQELLSNLGITHEESARTCRPHRHIVFLKKHKCASSTIFEILNRFKKKHKLYAASKPLASFVGGYPGKFKPEFVAPPQTDKYDIIFNHFRWDESAVRSVTHDDTIFLTSIREPLSHYKSVFDFFYGSYKRESGMVDHACNLACEGQPFLAMLGKAGEHFEKYMDCIPECYNASLPWSFRARNFQTFEMGLDAGPNFNSDLDQFTKAMDFVMITEKFAESILVMRKLLCMDFMDLYVQPKK